MKYVPANLTIDQNAVLSEMIERRRSLNEGWEIILVNELPPMSELREPTTIGTFTYSQMKSRRRWILLKAARNYGGGYTSAPGAARDYLMVRYGKERRRCTTKQYRDFVARPRPAPPLAAKVTHLEDAAYLDLQSAYWQILQRVGWDVDYSRGRFLVKKSDNSDFPFPEDKLARNSLVSAGVARPMMLWTGEKLVTQSSGNPLTNYVLWGATMDILNSFAAMMIRCGAVYVHTDGYIVPGDRLEDAQEEAARWGFILREKGRGKTSVHGIGKYVVGGRVGGLLHAHKTPALKVYDQTRFLRPRVHFLRRFEGV